MPLERKNGDVTRGPKDVDLIGVQLELSLQKSCLASNEVDVMNSPAGEERDLAKTVESRWLIGGSAGILGPEESHEASDVGYIDVLLV